MSRRFPLISKRPKILRPLLSPPFGQIRFMVANSWAIRQALHPSRLSRRSPKANQSSSFGARKLGAPRPRPKRKISAHKVLRSQPCGLSVFSAGKVGGERKRKNWGPKDRPPKSGSACGFLPKYWSVCQSRYRSYFNELPSPPDKSGLKSSLAGRQGDYRPKSQG